MCGICGIYYFGPNVAPDQNILRKMCDQVVHRGPNDEGYYINGPIALGMRRLSIIDLDGGSQPIFNEDESICVVHNGEIYNFQALRRALRNKGHRFLSYSDTEVIVHLYEEYGISFVEHLNGMFAIALWDTNKQKLILVRDRLGKKPLYYAKTSESLVFASEIKSLLEYSGVSREIDPQAVYNYFTLGYIPQPRSIYSAIRKLPPAGRLIAENERIFIDRYWQPPLQADRTLSKPMAREQLYELLFDAVHLRMTSDVPLGAFLSGGIDSSIVVALMAQLSTQPVKTFFIDFEESGYSERQYARAVAQYYGTDHHEFAIRPSALDILNDVVRHFDEPFGDSSAIPTWYVSQLTRKHVTVSLSGDGGDEGFGGYRRYRDILTRTDSRLLRRCLRLPGRGIHHLLPRRAPGRRYFRSLGMNNWQHFVVGTQELEAQELLSNEFRQHLERSVLDDLATATWLATDTSDPLAPYSQFDLAWYLPDDILTKVDRMSMAHSLEVRSPFLDYRVAELAARMPAKWKIQGSETKAILKEVFGNDLPASVLAPRKRGFSIPLAEWLRHELQSELRELEHNRGLKESGIFDVTEIRGLIDEHLSGARDRSDQLWRILFFARWWDTPVSNSNNFKSLSSGPIVGVTSSAPVS